MTTRGKIVLTIVLLAVVGFGVYRWWDKIAPTGKSQTVSIDTDKMKKDLAAAGKPAPAPAAGDVANKLLAGGDGVAVNGTPLEGCTPVEMAHNPVIALTMRRAILRAKIVSQL